MMSLEDRPNVPVYCSVCEGEFTEEGEYTNPTLYLEEVTLQGRFTPVINPPPNFVGGSVVRMHFSCLPTYIETHPNLLPEDKERMAEFYAICLERLRLIQRNEL